MKHTTLKHFIAIVPMGGVYAGKLGQHSTMQSTIEDATHWAANRFNKDRTIVVAECHDDSFSEKEANRIYKEGIKPI